MPLSSAPAGHRGVPRGWLLAGLVALSYFCTSLVVVLNALGNATGVVWLPSFPAGYYRFNHWLYWPFQGYFALLAPLPSAPAGELYDVRPDRLRTVPDRVRGRGRGDHDQVVPIPRCLLRSSHRHSRPAVSQ
jgi:hypothetical protein